MELDRHAQITFHLTGRLGGAGIEGIGGLDLKPALFARYHELAALRYDFPVVLVPHEWPEGSVRGLSELFDEALRAVTTADDAERTTKHARRIEREIRTRIAGGARGLLTEKFDKAVARLSLSDDTGLADSGARLRNALPADGEVLDCDGALPARLFEHVWQAANARKARRFRSDVDRLVFRLSEILRADFANSEAGRSPATLKASVGTTFEGAFDFDALSQTLARGASAEPLPDKRRQRIERTLETLRTQRFYPGPGASQPYNFVFESASAAVEAYRERLPNTVELARAMAIAELEVEGEYRESWHDPLFEEYGAHGLEPADLEGFPDYLVKVNAGKLKAQDSARIVEMLAMGLPMKVLVQTDDLLGEEHAGDGHLAFGLHNRFLASTAMSLSDVFVLQASASRLPAVRDRLVRGLSHPGPALFSVYSGAGSSTAGLPPYLVAAAAVEARAFPSFTYDPAKGSDWASRFDLEDNTQREADWPVHPFRFEDEAMGRAAEDVAFTFLDFAACDARYAAHYARVDRGRWNGTMVPVPAALSRDARGLPDHVPYVLMVDADNRLYKVLADQRLLREARRCRDMWRSLQELGGIHNSHAERLLETERRVWDEQHRQEARPAPPDGEAALAAPTAPVAPAPEAAEAPAAEPAAAEAPRGDDPYIETPRCTTCNECTQVNPRMFAYNENKQAYIADPDAGTFRELVEAAESCQVAIIHPGKPRNPDEPGLEELIERAEAFK